MTKEKYAECECGLRFVSLWQWVLVMASAPRVFAHGESADEPFLKDLTVAFYDIHISPTAVKVGDPVTITGSLKVLETWPYTLDPPQTAYLTPVVPGPVFALTERDINGDPAFGSIFIEKGGIYNFKMVMLARNPGHWHVHPGIAIQGTGTLIGPGGMGDDRSERSAVSPRRHVAQRKDRQPGALRRQFRLVVVVRRIPAGRHLDALLDGAETDGHAPGGDLADARSTTMLPISV